jgi:hypothetical protein
VIEHFKAIESGFLLFDVPFSALFFIPSRDKADVLGQIQINL